MRMNALDKVALALLIVGGLNWGLVGLFQYNLVDGIFGVDSVMSRIVYAIVGLAALYCVYTMTKMFSSTDRV